MNELFDHCAQTVYWNSETCGHHYTLQVQLLGSWFREWSLIFQQYCFAYFWDSSRLHFGPHSFFFVNVLVGDFNIPCHADFFGLLTTLMVFKCIHLYHQFVFINLTNQFLRQNKLFFPLFFFFLLAVIPTSFPDTEKVFNAFITSLYMGGIYKAVIFRYAQ